MTVDTSYLAGNPVYQGGSPQPTQGTVDPMGYVDRSLNNPPSDTRSGLAANMLDNQQQANTVQSTSSTTPAGTVNPVRDSTGSYYHKPIAEQFRADVTAAQGITPNTPSYGASAYTGPPVGVIVTYPDGKTANEFYMPKTQAEYSNLAQNGWKYNVTADMSSLMQSPQVQQGLDALTSSELTERNAIANALQNRLSSITQNEGQLQEQLPQELANNRAGFGGRGMLFSSGFANSEQNLLDAVARRVAGYEQDANTARVDSGNSLQRFLDSLNQKKVGLYGDQAAYDTKQLQDANVKAAIEKQLGLLGGTNVIPGSKMPKPVVKPVVKPPAKTPAKKVTHPVTTHKPPVKKIVAKATVPAKKAAPARKTVAPTAVRKAITKAVVKAAPAKKVIARPKPPSRTVPVRTF